MLQEIQGASLSRLKHVSSPEPAQPSAAPKPSSESSFLSELKAAALKRSMSKSTSSPSSSTLNASSSPVHTTVHVTQSSTSSSKPAWNHSAQPSSPSFKPSSPSKSISSPSKPLSSPSKPSSTFSKPIESSPISRQAPARILASSPEGWEERRTVDGVPYFFNSKTNCLSWEKPEALLTEAERAQGREQWVWVRDGDAGWAPVRVVR